MTMPSLRHQAFSSVPDYDITTTTSDVEQALPPQYTEQEERLPTYSRRSVSVPSVSLTFRQAKRHLMLLDSSAASSPVSSPRLHYTLALRSGPALFSSWRPDMVLCRVRSGGDGTGETFAGAGRAKRNTRRSKSWGRGGGGTSEGAETTGKEGPNGSESVRVASLRFDDSVALPWFPRAEMRLEHEDEHGPYRLLRMEARNFGDWAFDTEPVSVTVGEGSGAGTRLKWMLQSNPTSLGLLQVGTGLCVARFTYSADGTTARRGAEVGQLDIFVPGAWGLGTDGVVGSCAIALRHWARLGRHHRANSLTG